MYLQKQVKTYNGYTKNCHQRYNIAVVFIEKIEKKYN